MSKQQPPQPPPIPRFMTREEAIEKWKEDVSYTWNQFKDKGLGRPDQKKERRQAIIDRLLKDALRKAGPHD